MASERKRDQTVPRSHKTKKSGTLSIKQLKLLIERDDGEELVKLIDDGRVKVEIAGMFKFSRTKTIDMSVLFSC